MCHRDRQFLARGRRNARFHRAGDLERREARGSWFILPPRGVEPEPRGERSVRRVRSSPVLPACSGYDSSLRAGDVHHGKGAVDDCCWPCAGANKRRPRGVGLDGRAAGWACGLAVAGGRLEPLPAANLL